MNTKGHIRLLIALPLLAGIVGFAHAQTFTATVRNQTVSGTDLLYDVYMQRTDTTNIYLADADLVLTFNSGNFSFPAVSVVQVGTPGGKLNSWYSVSAALASSSRAIVNIFPPAFSNQTQFDTRVEAISNVSPGTMIARIKISGISNPSGTAGLTWRLATPNNSVVLSFSPVNPWVSSNITSKGTFTNPADIPLGVVNPPIASSISLHSGNNQSAPVTSTLADSLVVLVNDQTGAPYRGAMVAFSFGAVPIGAAGQRLSDSLVLSDANGRAGVRMALGSRIGTYTALASSTGLTGSPITFTATAGAGPASVLALKAGDGQVGQVGSSLQQAITVAVTDSFVNPLTGINVRFAFDAVPNGATGQVLADTLVGTGADGQASTTLKLGTKAGTYRIKATTPVLPSVTVTISATALAGPASLLARTSGDGQLGPVATSLPQPFTVTVSDSFSNPVPGVAVRFALESVPAGASGQALSDTSVTTSANGQASTTLKLGTKIGLYVVKASAGSFTSAVRFNATALAGPASLLSMSSGNNQIGEAGVSLPLPFVVAMSDTFGNPIAGENVRFAIESAPGGSTGQMLRDTLAVTDSVGRASATLQLGSRTGTYVVRATSSALPSRIVTFIATAMAGPASALVLSSGNAQSATPNTTLPNPFVVTVTDLFGNPVSGIAVAFSVSSSPTGAKGFQFNPLTTTTDSMGRAASFFTLGDVAGPYTVTATAGTGRLVGTPVTFVATASAGFVDGPATTIMLTSGDNQTAPVLTQLPIPFVVTVLNASGRPVFGVPVSFAIDSIPSAAIGQVLKDTSVVTDSLGRASTFLKLGNKIGVYSIKISSALTGSPIYFRAKSIVGPAAVMAYVTGNNQVKKSGSALDTALTVRITDLGGNGVEGISIAFAFTGVPVGSKGHQISTTIAATDSLGFASTALLLGDKPGIYIVSASSDGLVGNPILFTLQAIDSIARSVALETIPSKFELSQNYSNPFNPSTKIEFTLPG